MYCLHSTPSVAKRFNFQQAKWNHWNIKKKETLFNPRWWFPRIPAPSRPQVTAWLPSWWRRWMRCGERIALPSCGGFTSIILFLKAFKLLVKPLSDLSHWRDRFVSTYSDCCVLMVYSLLHVCFACFALIHWSMYTLCIQRRFPWFLCSNVGMVFQCDFIVLNDLFLSPPNIW